MENSKGRKAIRLENSRNTRAKAPIAAEFEDCSRVIQQLSESLQVHQSNSELHQIARDCALRLEIWARDCGAWSRSLDYALRDSPSIKKHVLRLLEDLHVTLDQATTEVRLQNPEEGDEKIPTLVPNAASVGFVDEDGLLDEQDFESDPLLYLEEAAEVVGCLFELLPSLRDPLEEEFDDSAAPDPFSFSEEQYQGMASWFFPNAPTNLIRRLGHSNSRRRKNIWRLSGKGSSRDRGLFRRQTIGNWAAWERQFRRGNGLKNYASQHRSKIAGSDAGTSTIVSHAESVLTVLPLVEQDSATSVTDNSQPTNQHPPAPPLPPVELPRNEAFNCPYCRSELPLVLSSKPFGDREWNTHIYHDLKPYMCTFDNCIKERRLYSNKTEWFQHELNSHRCLPVWSCCLCEHEHFRTSDEFDAHLKTVHPTLSQVQHDLIKESCRRFSDASVQDCHCNLCGVDCHSLDELEHHLGNHLEEFALGAFMDNEPSPEGEMDNGIILQEFLEDLPPLHEQDEKAVPDSINSNGEVSRGVSLANQVGQHADHADLAEFDPENPGPYGDHWRVQKYLDAAQEPLPIDRRHLPSRFENFVGRDVDLQNIHGHLSTPGQICTISGRGGIGKTAIAVEYLYQYVTEYSNVFWVEAETSGPLAEQYGNIANSLDMGEKNFAHEDARTFHVRESLTKTDRRWLLVFDNVGNWTDISRYIPRHLPRTQGSILITTRTATLLPQRYRYPSYHNLHSVELEVWPLEHGREFLLTSIQPKLKKEDLQAHDEYNQAAQVCEKVGRLPLAISMIVGYVKVSRCTLADFLEMWEEKEHINKKRRRNVEIGENDIDSTIDSLWTIGIREVRMNSRRLLDILSFLDPERIQKSLLVGDHIEDYLEFLNSSEALSFKRMINELRGRRLLGLKDSLGGDQGYSIHRLLQQKILLDMEDYGFIDAFRKAFRLIRKVFPEADPQQVPSARNADKFREYIGHVFAFHRIYENNASKLTSLLDPTPEELARLFYDAGFHYWARQNPALDALNFLTTAETILEGVFLDPFARVRADILCMTGLLNLNVGCIERAEGMRRLERALHIRKQNYEDNKIHNNDVLLQNAANDFALCLLNEHRFEEAGALFRGCRDRYISWGTDDDNPFENSKFYGNYAVIYMFRGDLDKALQFQEKSVRLVERFAGKKGLYYRRVFMQACFLLQSGDIQGALDKHLDVLTNRLELLGKHHEETILSTYAVGALYHQLGDVYTATEYIRQCIEWVKTAKWDRAALARAQCHLAMLYRERAIEEEQAAELEAESQDVLNEFSTYAAECVQGLEDKLMVLDDLQPTFMGRYTSTKLLLHLRASLR